MVQNEGTRVRPRAIGWDALLNEHVLEGSAGKMLLDNGLMYRDRCKTGMTQSTTTIVLEGLKNLKNDQFNTEYYMQIILNSNSAGNAPQSEVRKITDYVASTGTFTTNAFTTNVQEEDEVLILHESIASLLTAVTGAGELAMAGAIANLNQAAGTYDLLTGTGQEVEIESLVLKISTGAVGGSLTSISVHTDDATPTVFISATLGAVAKLTSEADLSWKGRAVIKVGTKIQYTIGGGAHGSAKTADVDAQYRSRVTGGTLV